jgi:hypothetical protein
MKYLTKEWLNIYEKSFIIKWLRVQKIGERTEGKLYEKKKAEYIELERVLVEEINKDNEEEKRKIKEYLSGKSSFWEVSGLLEDMGQILSRKPIQFEEVTAEKWFDERINRRIELCRTLPKEILNEIENIRLFSLGATTKEIREKVKAYCREQRREAVKTEKLAQRKTEQVEGILKLPIEFALYKERPILKMEQKGSDLYIELDDLPKLIIRNITFIEREKEYYYKWNENEYACPWTYVLESELHFIKGRYEVHFLLETRHKSGKTENWYYTVSGTNIEIEEE